LAEFFSFGTNDLTQTTFGISRDDAEKGFLLEYLDKKHPAGEPVCLDRRGRRRRADGHGVKLGRAPRPGWRSASAASTAATRSRSTFCHRIGLDYVSCSPFRVPIARLAAAHAALKHGK
jgi:pyruvate,orthophosphate dikinase